MPKCPMGISYLVLIYAQMPNLIGQKWAEYASSKFRLNAQMPNGHFSFTPYIMPKCPNAHSVVPPPRPKFHKEAESGVIFRENYLENG